MLLGVSCCKYFLYYFKCNRLHSINKDLAQTLNMTDTVEFLSDCGILFWGILMILCAYMYAERYLYLESKKQTGLGKYIYLGGFLILGKIVVDKIVAIGGYITWNWNLLKNLKGCIEIKCLIAIMWVICLIFFIKQKKAFIGNNNVKRLMIICGTMLTLFIGVTTFGEEYVSKEARMEWYKVCEEYFENCDPRVDEHPSRN